MRLAKGLCHACNCTYVSAISDAARDVPELLLPEKLPQPQVVSRLEKFRVLGTSVERQKFRPTYGVDRLWRSRFI